MAKKTFEQSIKELEKIVADLESGDLPLEKALKRFEDGIKLSKTCSEMLDQTKQRISILLKDEKGEIHEKLFDNNQQVD